MCTCMLIPLLVTAKPVSTPSFAFIFSPHPVGRSSASISTLIKGIPSLGICSPVHLSPVSLPARPSWLRIPIMFGLMLCINSFAFLDLNVHWVLEAVFQRGICSWRYPPRWALHNSSLVARLATAVGRGGICAPQTCFLPTQSDAEKKRQLDYIREQSILLVGCYGLPSRV